MAVVAQVHKAFEDNFWATKMNLPGASIPELTRTKCVRSCRGDTRWGTRHLAQPCTL